MKKLTLLFTALLTVLLLASPVYAADIRLSSSCSLADAIIAANRDRPEGGCPAGRGADSIALTRDITLYGGLPKITSNIAIEGNGYAISGGNRYRMFYNDGGALTIKDLTMTKGYVEGDLIRNADGKVKNATANPFGGAIVNWKGTLTVSDSAFSGNSANIWGGAIYNFGELIISESVFSDNSAESGGAILNGGELSISDSTFSDNSAEAGGAVHNVGELSISDSVFSGNSTEYGGAIVNWRGTVAISDSTFSGNSTEYGGGAINNSDGELNIINSSFSDNSAESGGAIANYGYLSISESSFSDNSAESGGAIANGYGELSIVNSSFSDNSAEGGGAITNGDDGELSISESSFSGNSAKGGGAAIFNLGELSIVNSTFSGSSANIWGGAIYNSGELGISESSFSGNSAELGGAVANFGEGELSMINSIIAGRGKDACYSESRLKRNISNFIQDGSCNPAFRGDPKLGALVTPTDGSPAYFPLLAGSPAIDAADDEYCPATDQIGTARPQGAGCDIGAIEYVSP